MEDAIDHQSLNLYGIRREVGDEKTLAVLMAHIVRLDNTMHLKSRMNEEQIRLLAQEIMQNYSWLNMADIKLVMDRVSLGKSGKAYERLDPRYVLTHLEDYVEERMRTSEERRLKEQEMARNETKDNEFVMKMYDNAKRASRKREEEMRAEMKKKLEMKEESGRLTLEDEVRKLQMRLNKAERMLKEQAEEYQKALSDAEDRERHTQWALDYAAEQLGKTSYQIRKEEQRWREDRQKELERKNS